MSLFAEHRFVVVGAGKTGLAAARFIASQKGEVCLFDEGDIDAIKAKTHAHNLNCSVQKLSEWRFEKRDLCVLSPGVPRALTKIQQALSAGVNVINEIDVALKVHAPQKMVGITGTNGKSTTTTILGAILKAHDKNAFVGGNLGTPYCEALLEGARPSFAALELSSYQLETLSERFLDAAMVTNLAPDHLDRYEDVESYYAAKNRIYALLKEGGRAIINGADQTSSEHLSPSSPTTFGKGDVQVMGETLEAGEYIFSLKNESIVGPHNKENAAAAVAAALSIGVSESAIKQGLSDYAGIEHRMELVCKHEGVRWFNDSKATNVAATLVALKSFEKGIHIILGGVGKGASYAPLVKASKERGAKVYVIGDDAKTIASAFDYEVHQCGTLEAAVARIKENIKTNDVVLLSPACASFDQFKNFKVRGEAFRALCPSKREMS